MQASHRIAPRIIIAVLAVGLLALAAILLTPSPSSADPVVSWTPQAVTENITPGASKTIAVSLVSSEDVADVAVRVVPELAPFVRTDPASFPQLLKGQPATLSLTIAAGQNTSFGVFDGTIQLTFSKKTLAKPLPIDVTYSVVPVPPDPGEAGKATLEGIDSDNDGVRDDVQRYIVLTYPDSEKIRAAQTQFAVSLQQKLLDAEDKGLSIEHAKNRDARDCLLFVYSEDIDTAIEAIRGLQKESLNTPQRVKAWELYDSHLIGQIFIATLPSQRRAKCVFDPDALEN